MGTAQRISFGSAKAAARQGVGIAVKVSPAASGPVTVDPERFDPVFGWQVLPRGARLRQRRLRDRAPLRLLPWGGGVRGPPTTAPAPQAPAPSASLIYSSSEPQPASSPCGRRRRSRPPSRSRAGSNARRGRRWRALWRGAFIARITPGEALAGRLYFLKSVKP